MRYHCQEQADLLLLRLAPHPTSHDVINTFARNMSMGGCSFELDHTTNLPELLAMRLFLPGGSGSVELEGRIVWQRPGEKGLCAGVAFPGFAEDERRRLEEFFRNAASDMVPTVRQQAIAQFESGIRFYHQQQFAQATREFQKVIKEYAAVIDVARGARRYYDWCVEEKEGRTHG